MTNKLRAFGRSHFCHIQEDTPQSDILVPLDEEVYDE
jgi:hypothetical protein